jgi:hypothetical protein
MALSLHKLRPICNISNVLKLHSNCVGWLQISGKYVVVYEEKLCCLVATPSVQSPAMRQNTFPVISQPVYVESYGSAWNRVWNSWESSTFRMNTYGDTWIAADAVTNVE